MKKRRHHAATIHRRGQSAGAPDLHKTRARFAVVRLLPSLRVVLSVASCWLLSGCPRPPVLVRPYPTPTAAELVAHVQKGRAGLFALRARAKADVSSSEGSVKVDIAMIAARPQRLRLAAENSLTGPLLTLSTDGEKFQLLDVRQNRFESGVVSPCNMLRILGVGLHPSQVIEVLLGGVPFLANPTGMEVAWDGRDGGREVLTLRNDLGHVEVIALQAEGRTWDVREAEGRDATGQIVWRLRHETFNDEPLSNSSDDAKPASGPTVRLPKVTSIEDPPHKSNVRLRWREREMNPQVNPEIFTMTAPDGMTVSPDVCATFPRPAMSAEPTAP